MSFLTKTNKRILSKPLELLFIVKYSIEPLAAIIVPDVLVEMHRQLLIDQRVIK